MGLKPSGSALPLSPGLVVTGLMAARPIEEGDRDSRLAWRDPEEEEGAVGLRSRSDPLIERFGVVRADDNDDDVDLAKWGRSRGSVDDLVGVADGVDPTR